MSRDNTVEIIEAVSKMASDVARNVAEGIGEGIAKAMGYGQGGIVIPESPTPEPENESWFPDVEMDNTGWINPELGETNVP